MLVKQSRNLDIKGTITRTLVVIIKSFAHVRSILIDKNNPSNVLRRGNYWRGTLKTSTIWALDAEDFV